MEATGHISMDMISRVSLSITVERLRLRLQICLNLMQVSICLNFGRIVYFMETEIQKPKIIETCA